MYNPVLLSVVLSLGFLLSISGVHLNKVVPVKLQNSCNASNGGCEQICETNATGSIFCSCKKGFQLTQDGKHCEDIDECKKNISGCSYKCNNTLGSYSCSCKPGYKLKADKHGCQDIDECKKNISGCSHKCNNTLGSYSCSCKPGYKLKADKHGCQDINECLYWNGGCDHNCINFEGGYNCTCKPGYTRRVGNKLKYCQDIDECQRNNGGCFHKCSNNQGSYSCSCKPGYQLKADKHGCQDIDECRNNNGGCSHKCSNKPGSYSCSCNPGYELKADKHGCQDIDECLKNNGGCSHKCSNKPGSYSCTCNPGYELKADKHGCQDINECRKYNGRCHHNCINKAGSFMCSCRHGYRLKDSRFCEDVNECLIKNGNCDHFCYNLPGKRKCFCRIGFELNWDQQTCADTNECSNNKGGCSHGCHNTAGSFSCLCPTGYYLGWDRRTCKVIQCGSPPYTAGGVFNCQDGVEGKDTYGTQCSVNCTHGYILKRSANNLTCDRNGNWTGTQPTCERVQCAALKEFDHSSVYPKTCLKKVDWDSTCYFSCKHGYKLTGPSLLKCLHTGKWSANQVGQKCEDNEPPFFNQTCPQNIYKKTDHGKAFATVSWTPPTATDNSGQVTMSTIPSDLTVPYAFNIGENKVTYTATDPNNLKVNCSFIVVVQDVEKPRMICPPTSTVIGARPYVNVTWTPPNITDNSGEVVSVRSSLKNGTELTYGVYPVMYTAKDKAGNTEVCSFKVIVRKKSCKTPQRPANGSITCDSWLYGGFCTVSCKKRFGFAIPPAPKYVCGLDGDWHPKKTPPSCSGLVDADEVVLSIQLRFPSLACNSQIAQTDLLSMVNSIINGFVVESISNCAQNSLRCIHTVSPHCDSLGVINVNVNISVKALSGHRLYNNTRDILHTIEKKIASLESAMYIKASMQSQTTAICNQPGMVTSGQYCVRCPVDTYHNGSRCENCPIGTSQPKEGQTKCIKTAALHTKIKSI